MKEFVTAQDISEALGITERAVHKRAEREDWPSRIVTGRGRGGKKLYPFEPLPSDIKQSLSDRWLQTVLAPASLTLQSSPVDQTPSATRGACLDERLHEKGLARFRLVEKWREVVATQPWGKQAAATASFLLAYRSGQLLPNVWRIVGDVSDKTLYRLDKLLRDSNNDYLAIADGRGGWRKYGTNRWKPRQLSLEAQEAFLRCYNQPTRPSVSLAIQAARMTLAQEGLVEAAHETTWRRWFRDFEKRNNHVLVMGREGEKAYKDKVAPYITRDASLLKVGQVLVADGHTLNFQVLHPYTGKPARMTLIAWFDWASRFPVGWQIMPTENTVAIAAALRMAIGVLGKYPDAVYIDNGKAFKSRFFTETDPDLAESSGLYARLGIATCFSTPYNARAKIVERFWNTMSDQCEVLMPTFCGGSINDKPAWLLRNEKFHQALHEAKTKGWVPTIREAAHLLGVYFNWYGRQPHEGLGGRAPFDVLESGRGPGVDVSELDRRFLWSKKVTPSRCRITLFGIDYESDCLHGVKGRILVYYDTADLGTVICAMPDGETLGEARPVQALPPLARLFGDLVGVDQVKHALERQRRLARETKKNLQALGAPPEQVEGLKALPWNRKEPVLLQGGKREDPPQGGDPAPSPERDRRLELVYRSLAPEEGADTPAIPRPEYFQSEYDRYDWCFRAKHQHGRALGREDELFMAYIESKDEFRENFKGRYDDLLELYALCGDESRVL